MTELKKYVYLCFIKWTAEAHKAPDGYWVEWIKKHDELCHENDVELVVDGSAFGCAEDRVYGYATDMHRDAFQDFLRKVRNLHPEISTDYSKTFQVYQRRRLME